MGNQPTTLIDPASTSHKAQPVSNTNKSLDGFVKRLSLGKKLSISRSKKKKANYFLPPNAERPSSPSRPEVFQDQDQYFILRWDPPAFDGGIALMGYVIQHLELGLPQLDNQDQDDTEAWYSSDPGLITQTECILNNLVPGTTYQFRVVAENLIGYSLPSDVSEPIVFNPYGELDDWFYAPMFTATLEDKYVVMEHEMLTLSVDLKGQPYPIVRWYDKHDQDLCKQNNKRYKTCSNGTRRSLVINSVELSDAGVIKCLGINKEGQVECSTLLLVEAPPRIKRVKNPEFLQNPYDVNEREEERVHNFLDDDYEDLIFQAGELVRLKFLFSGSPLPELTIFHNGEQVTDSRVVTEFTDKVITIRIENILRYDRGEWLIKLENDLGEDCTSVLITITDRPEKPGKPEVLTLSDNTCVLRWDQPIDDGGCPIHNYTVEYFRTEWGVWLKALTSKNPGAKIKDLIPGSKYRFRVKAENLYGGSEPSDESEEILITTSLDRLMPSLEESVEEESMEILSHSDFQDYNDDMKYSPQKGNLPINLRPPSPRPRKSEDKSPTEDPSKKLYNRGDLIRSAVTSSVDYVQRFLSETGKADSKDDDITIDEEYEYDFDKLQQEYEEEMRALRDQLEDHSDEDFDDEDEEDEEEEENGGEEKGKGDDDANKKDDDKEKEEVIPKKEESDEEKDEDYQEEFIWPRRTVKEKPVQMLPTLGDRFTDYLTMKIASRDKRIGGSMRSLHSIDKSESRENLKKLLDFENERSVTPQEFDQDLDEAVQIQTVRKAIILNEEKLERERLEREKLKEIQKQEAIQREIALEERRKLNRKQQSVEVVLEEKVTTKIDPEVVSKIVLVSILILIIPVYWYYDVYVMLFCFVLLLLVWNKLKVWMF